MVRSPCFGHHVPVTATSHPPFRPGQAPAGDAHATARQRASGASSPESPAATRAPGRTWKDPRLLIGLVIVAVCVLLGARLMATADDTVAVWSVRSDMPAGATVGTGDLVRQDLRFGSPELASRYLSAEDALPEGILLSRDVAAGELLPRAALASTGGPELVEVPIALASEAVPSTLRTGELVDVWVTPPADTGQEPRAVRVLHQVHVVSAPRDTTALGPSATRQVVVGLPSEDEGVLASALARLSVGTAVIIRRG